VRDLCLVAIGVLLGVYLVDFLQGHERRVAYRAADLAREDIERRARFAKADEPPTAEPAA
jgi:hypothetical protein